MTALDGGVAVITGAAGGIGRALALAFAREGMTVAIADRDAEGLASVASLLRDIGVTCAATTIDVTDEDQVAELADHTRAELGEVTVVCSNAGVMIPGAVWEVTSAHWRATLDVNVLGPVHLARQFLPAMIASGRPGHFLSTVGLIGLFTSAFSPPGSYAVSKHATLAFAEVLYEELQTIGAPIGVTALMPAGVRTGFAVGRDAADGPTVTRDDVWPLVERLRSSIQEGIDPDDVAAAAVAAVRADEFWVFTQPEVMHRVEHRFDYVRRGTPPTSPYRST